MISTKILNRMRVPPGGRVKLSQYPTSLKASLGETTCGEEALKNRALEILGKRKGELSAAQELLYANGTYAVLLIFQAMDAGGKDGTIRHVMSGVNPQGCQVFNFKQPSEEELQHNFLWRCSKCLPERGRIGIFNRSYYEDVLVLKVHPDRVDARLPKQPGKKFWAHRYADIHHFEKHLHRNGTLILKFFLHLSKKEQKKRLEERLNDPSKNWKFSASDLKERAYWKEYERAFEDAFAATSSRQAPWYVIPADEKHVARALVADVIVRGIAGLGLRGPKLSKKASAGLAKARKQLAKE